MRKKISFSTMFGMKKSIVKNSEASHQTEIGALLITLHAASWTKPRHCCSVGRST